METLPEIYPLIFYTPTDRLVGGILLDGNKGKGTIN
jgi:hypothetical protein